MAVSRGARVCEGLWCREPALPVAGTDPRGGDCLAVGWVSVFPETQQLGRNGLEPLVGLGISVPLSHSELRTWFLG